MTNVNTNYTDIFSSMMGTSGTENNNAFSLTDYMSIKSGSYGKLLKAYYKKQDTKDAETAETEKKQLSLLKTKADNLKNSMLDLMDEDLFKKKTIKTKDEKTGEETEKEDYDWEAITKAVNSFVDSYNSIISATGDSDNQKVLRNATWLTQMTETNSKLLAKVGITIGDDNKLKVDADTLKKANINTLQVLFQGAGSYADKVVQKASQIGSAAVQGTSVGGSSYTNNADYKKLSSNGYLFDNTF
ncbi:MAG: hypothetical protein HDR00_02165 [Lachnospiraceae bacterium]|nr:hypothetical protein [Lachnospiraceae bacterium]